MQTTQYTQTWGDQNKLLKATYRPMPSCGWILEAMLGNRDMVTVKMIYEGGIKVWRAIITMWEVCWNEEKLPEQFFLNTIVPLFKRDNRGIPKNYRPVTLMLTIAKLWQRVLYNRVETWAADQDGLENGLAGGSQ